MKTMKTVVRIFLMAFAILIIALLFKEGRYLLVLPAGLMAGVAAVDLKRYKVGFGTMLFIYIILLILVSVIRVEM